MSQEVLNKPTTSVKYLMIFDTYYSRWRPHRLVVICWTNRQFENKIISNFDSTNLDQEDLNFEDSKKFKTSIVLSSMFLNIVDSFFFTGRKGKISFYMEILNGTFNKKNSPNLSIQPCTLFGFWENSNLSWCCLYLY